MFVFGMKNYSLNCKGRLLSLSEPLIMGILNATPDSFYTKGINNSASLLLHQAIKMIDEGASILDIGGMSSRPGADPVSEDEELNRVLPAIEAIRKQLPNSYISIDTYRSNVAKQALVAGADIINDISGGDEDENILTIAAQNHAPFICMHKKGVPKTMQHNPTYQDVLDEVMTYFIEKIEKFRKFHLHDVVLDVGFGFGKNLEHNYELLNNLSIFHTLQKPLLAGFSRKSMICKPLHISPEEALNGTTILNTLALTKGCQILRVHDVKEAKECVTLFNLMTKRS